MSIDQTIEEHTTVNAPKARIPIICVTYDVSALVKGTTWTSFGGLGGAVQIEDSTKPSKLPKVWPMPKSEICNRLPIIRVDLSEYPGVKLEEIEMKVTGFGSVPAEFDELTGILKWKTTRRLRVEKHSVYISFVDPSNGRNKSFSWPFVVNLEAFYLPEYSEKIKIEEESSAQFFQD